MRKLILASSSPYRRALLKRLGLPFEAVSPNIDESHQNRESPSNLVKRLAQAKAEALVEKFPNALIIGSDQCAVINDRILGKPGDFPTALAQLQEASGKKVQYHTGLCLLDSNSGAAQVTDVVYSVYFRRLSEAQITSYLLNEQPYNCAGSIKSEGLGIALFERMQGDDPNALIGLPLIKLISMLENAGVPVI